MSKRVSPASSSPSSDSEAGDHPTPRQPSLTSDTGHIPTTDVSDLAATLIEEAPEPQPHAIAQAAADRAQTAEDNKDAEGTQFDPSLHSGTKTTGGIWRKKSGRKPGATSGGPRARLNIPGASSRDSAPSAESPGNEAKIAEARATGVVAANLFLMFSVAIGGDEWQPRNENEKPMLEQGFAGYFESQQWTDLPPWLGLCACIGMYALPRFAMPKTKARATGFKAWVVGKYINWRASRARKAYERKFGPTAVARADDASREAYERERQAHAEAAAKVNAS